MTNTSALDVEPGTIVVFSDLICPFTHIAVHRLFTTCVASDFVSQFAQSFSQHVMVL